MIQFSTVSLPCEFTPQNPLSPSSFFVDFEGYPYNYPIQSCLCGHVSMLINKKMTKINIFSLVIWGCEQLGMGCWPRAISKSWKFKLFFQLILVLVTIRFLCPSHPLGSTELNHPIYFSTFIFTIVHLLPENPQLNKYTYYQIMIIYDNL